MVNERCCVYRIDYVDRGECSKEVFDLFVSIGLLEESTRIMYINSQEEKESRKKDIRNSDALAEIKVEALFVIRTMEISVKYYVEVFERFDLMLV
jgi:hypothetical protein